MGTIAVSAICDQVGRRLFDETKLRWKAKDLVDYYNETIRLYASHKPAAFVTTSTLATVTGAKQTLPAGANFLLGMPRNVASGRPIRQVQKAVLDNLPGIDWYAKSGTDVELFVYDRQNPKVVWIYPQPPAAHQVEVECASDPTPATENAGVISGTLSIDDTDQPFVVLGMLACAMEKNTLAVDMSKAAFYASQFAAHLGIKMQGQFAFSKMTREPPKGDE